MKALVFRNGLHYQTDYPLPKPHEKEALIRITRAGICNTDIEIIKSYMSFSGIPGHEFTGIVEECEEKNLIGKRVVGEINIGCNKCSYCRKKMQNHCPDRSVLGILNKDGAFAEYITLPVGNLHLIPDSISDEEAVFVEPLAAAFEILRQVSISSSDEVCVLGDGKLGLLAGQVLASTACNLVVAGKHKEKLSILEEMGIKTELVSTDTAGEIHRSSRQREDGGGQFDIVIDCTGSPLGIKSALHMVRPGGKIILKTTVAESVPLDVNQFVIREVTLIGSRCGPFPPAINAIETKKVDLSGLVSGTYALEDGIKAIEFASRRGVLKVILRLD
jgi:threonine dehydrogenase-like Zn-dependent dehydrogenase